MSSHRLSRRGLLATTTAGTLTGCIAQGRDPTADDTDAPQGATMETVTVGQGKYRGTTNALIQRAVDAMASAGGGTVVVSPGVYEMRDALHLRSGVRVVGRDGAVLRKAPSAESRIPAFLGYGHYELVVAEPDKFPVGTGVHVLDTGAGGFYTTVATVVARQGDRLFINRMLNHDYHARKTGRVVSVYPLVEAEDVHDAAVENLTLDGRADQQSMALNGCRGGGVFLIRSRRVALRRIEVANYRGDAVSFQQCTDILVEGCHLHHNAGSGLHPGSGSVRYVMQDNRVHANGGCGLYYCLRTTHSICRRNAFRANAREGISIGERDTDHRIEDNTVVDNRKEGLLWRGFVYRGGDRVVLTGNTIGSNGADGKRSQIALVAGLRDVHVLDNTIAPAQRPAVRIGGACHGVSVSGNRIAGRAQRDDDIKGLAQGVSTRRAEKLPDVHPAALPLDGARHLAIAKLDAWHEKRMWPPSYW